MAFNTLCPVQFNIHWCVVNQWTHWGLYLKKWFVPALEVTFLKKLPQLVALRIFQYTYLSYVESIEP